MAHDAADEALLRERDGSVARFALREYVCLRSCLRESLTECWPAGSPRWTEAVALFHALPSASSRAATWAPESGWVALKGRGRWAPVEALALAQWAAPVYLDGLRTTYARPWSGGEWLPRLTATLRDVEALRVRLEQLTARAGQRP